ncbi:hypothetical protein DFH09DRAFT_1080536 [Mycena vulgaris]|nr:hypothetical protein DFH09DRAFT_1080536 [Mycena vulgaris]
MLAFLTAFTVGRVLEKSLLGRRGLSHSDSGRGSESQGGPTAAHSATARTTVDGTGRMETVRSHCIEDKPKPNDNFGVVSRKPASDAVGRGGPKARVTLRAAFSFAPPIAGVTQLPAPRPSHTPLGIVHWDPSAFVGTLPCPHATFVGTLTYPHVVFVGLE